MMGTTEQKEGKLLLLARHAIKYYTVGATGIFVNLAILYMLTELLGLWYMLSYVVSMFSALTSNFILNKIWTFKDTIQIQKTMAMYKKFIAVSLVGMGIQLGGVYILVERLSIYYLHAAILSIAVASGLNFVVNRHWTFDVKL